MIKLQKQPNNWSCCHTCIAMAMDVPVEQVIAKSKKQYGLSELEFTQLLHDCHIVFNKFVYGNMMYTGYYFMTVPSLNNVGGMHKIIVHCNCDTGKLTVFDPSTRKRYVEDGFNLLSWSDLTGFKTGGKL